MIEIDQLSLLLGIDIPFPQAAISIHVPTLEDISHMKENRFFLACEVLVFSKEFLSEQDKTNLENQTNFDIIMSMIKEPRALEMQIAVTMLLTLMFPYCQILLNDNNIELIDQEGEKHIIDNSNFDDLQKIIKVIFNLKDNKEEKYNPRGDLASKIAKKLEERKRKLAERANKLKKEEDSVAVFARYVSILCGRFPFTDIKKYTVYELFETFMRIEAEEQYKTYVKAKMAGAKDLEEVDHWMKDLHP